MPVVCYQATGFFIVREREGYAKKYTLFFIFLVYKNRIYIFSFNILE